MCILKNLALIFVAAFIVGCAQTTKTSSAQSPQEQKICRINVNGEFKDFPSCFSESNSDGSLTVKPEILSQINFTKTLDKRVTYSDFSRSQPQSPVHSASVVGYIIPSGKAHDVIFLDNGPDYFLEGAARFVSSNGKTGYINQDLKVVLAPIHDFASPFDEGKAYFCNGCKSVSDGEKQKIVGGLWGTMDKKGKVLKGPQPYEKFFSIKK